MDSVKLRQYGIWHEDPAHVLTCASRYLGQAQSALADFDFKDAQKKMEWTKDLLDIVANCNLKEEAV